MTGVRSKLTPVFYWLGGCGPKARCVEWPRASASISSVRAAPHCPAGHFYNDGETDAATNGFATYQRLYGVRADVGSAGFFSTFTRRRCRHRWMRAAPMS